MSKKITYIIDGLGYGGAERIVQALATDVHASGRFDVEVITLWAEPLAGQIVAQELMEAGIRVVQIPKKSKIAWSMYRALRNHLRATKPDVVHTHLFAADVWGARAAYTSGVPVIISTEHNINNDEGFVKEKLRCYTNRYRNAIVAVSQSVERYIAEICPSAELKTHLIYNGIDHKRFGAVRAQRVWHDLTDLRIAVIGRLTEQKGQLHLIHSLAGVTVPYHLRIIGDGTLRGIILRTIDEWDLHQRITVEQARTDIEEVYKQTDVVIVPSLWEGFGLVAAEAMAAGCIVIAAPVDGLTEIIHNEQTGFLVDTDSTEELQRVLEQVCEDEPLRLHIQEAAYEYVSQELSYEHMLAQYIGLYDSFESL